MQKPYLGLSIMYEPEFIQAVFPLFNEELVDAIEWSIDIVLNREAEPEWLDPLLTEFSAANRLVGHGVHFSTLDAHWNPKQQEWLEKLEEICKRHHYEHITEHFGFMSSANAHRGCPLPLSMDQRILDIGHDRLKRLQEVAGVPIGLENLALSFSADDIKKQGEFLSKLVEPVNGFLILDLHNLYCQSHNFNIPLIELVKMYPLHLVKEMHISGGSWVDSIYKDKKIRRDTHDEAVPEIIFDILPEVIQMCPHLEYIIHERLGSAFRSESDAVEHQNDYRRLRKIVDKTAAPITPKKWGNNVTAETSPLNIDSLYNEQRAMHKILLEAKNLIEVKEKLSQHFNIETWDDEMVNTAALLTKKWD